MTDEDVLGEDPANEGDRAPFEVAPDWAQDWWLEQLVRLANKEILGVSVTLFVGGAIVSGELVGVREYFRGNADHVARFVDDADGKEEIRAALRKPAEMMEGEPMPERLSFIHLKDAIPWTPTGSTVNRAAGTWWRGRLAAVDGWQFGRYE